MKPDWEELGDAFEKSKKVVIGDVDCTGDGESLCQKYGVEGYPTLMYFNPPDTEGEKYEGDRSLKALKKFAKGLGPGCTVSTLDKCTEKQKAELQSYIDLGEEVLTKRLADAKLTIENAQAEHDALMKELQEKFGASEEHLKQLKDQLAPEMKMLKAALPPKPEAPPKDEV